jgi:hypothetical protein
VKIQNLSSKGLKSKGIDLTKYTVNFANQDPGSGAFLTPGYGMGIKSGSGSGSEFEMNNPDHISESLETIFGLKYLISLMRTRDPGWKKFGSGIQDGKNLSGIQDKHPGSATLVFWIH